MFSKGMDGNMTEHRCEVVRFTFPERSFWLLCTECWGRDQDTSDYTAMTVLPRNDRASTKTEVMEWKVGPETQFRRVGTW